jgi:hypothetical protein
VKIFSTHLDGTSLIYLHSYHGGWIAPNMYFLGHAGCVQVNGIRIAGSSGIFKAGDFRQGMSSIKRRQERI